MSSSVDQQAGPSQSVRPHLEVGMTKQVQLSHGARSGTDRLSEVEALHRSLDARIQELASRVYLTPAEKVEVADLKKQNLKLKDELQAIRAGSS